MSGQERTNIEVVILRFGVFNSWKYPYLQEFQLFFITAIVFTVINAAACTHNLNITRSDGFCVLYTVTMFQVTFQRDGITSIFLCGCVSNPIDGSTLSSFSTRNAPK